MKVTSQLRILTIVLASIYSLLSACSNQFESLPDTIDVGNVSVSIPRAIVDLRINSTDLVLKLVANGVDVPMTLTENNRWMGTLTVPYGETIQVSAEWSTGNSFQPPNTVLATIETVISEVTSDRIESFSDSDYVMTNSDGDDFSNIQELNTSPPTDINDPNSFPGRTPCGIELAKPRATIEGYENYTTDSGEFTRFLFEFENSSDYSPKLFEQSPDLPPCGLNQNSSRTWVDIFDSSGERIYGFCNLTNPEDLNDTWFAIPSGTTPQSTVSVRLTDRLCETSSESDPIDVPIPDDAENNPINACEIELPKPQVTIGSYEHYSTNSGEFTRFFFEFENSSDYPPELFEQSPDLPPCGLNQNASRTWVDIFGPSGERIYGFCGLASPESLNRTWFAIPFGTTPQSSVSVRLTDRLCETSSDSDPVDVPIPADAESYPDKF